MPCVVLQYVVVVFPDHTYFLVCLFTYLFVLLVFNIYLSGALINKWMFVDSIYQLHSELLSCKLCYLELRMTCHS